MKTNLLSGLLLLVTTASGLSQGTITFANGLSALRAPIFGPEEDWVNHGGDWADAKTGNTSSGVPAGTQVYQGNRLESFIVRFWAAPGIVADGHLLQQGNLVAATGSGITAGIFPTSLVTFANLPPSGVATVQVRVYDPSGPLAFGVDSSGWIAATSALFQVDIGNMATELRSFSVGWLDQATLAPYVPEPNIGCLVVSGAVVLALHSRSRRVC